MRDCGVCDLPISRGAARLFIGDEMIHSYCSTELRPGEKVCPHPCNLIHAGPCEF